jgi:radical SAM superfamily enzyme YgiQ (UPF0313 family)
MPFCRINPLYIQVMTMNYEGQICRSPMERGSFMLPVSVGCSYNRCRFCMLFKHLTYRLLPLEQVRAEIDRIAGIGGNPKRIFLGDGSAFSLPTDRLLQILDWIREAFPGCESVSMDATVRNVLQKTDADLAALHEHLVTDLYLGIECGLEDVLKQMEKGNTLREAEEAIERLHAAGIGYDAHIMTGICGAGRGEENAASLADFFNRTRPERICNFSLFLHRSAPLYEDILAGRFQPADERENLLEELRLLEAIGDYDLVYEGFHDMLPLRVRGKLPKDREKMCQRLKEGIAALDANPEDNVIAYCC